MASIRFQFASREKKGVILYQAPKKHTCMLQWDLKNDQVKVGQWIKNKIPYFDINSDGSLFLGFVQNYRRTSKSQGPYAVLSKVPYFSALVWWEIGDSWGGHCGFIDDRTLYVQPSSGGFIQHGTLAKGFRPEVCGGREKQIKMMNGWCRRNSWLVEKNETPESAEVWVKYSDKTGFGLRTDPKFLPIYSPRTAFWRDPKNKKSAEVSVELPPKSYYPDLDPKGRLLVGTQDSKIKKVTREPHGGFSLTSIIDLSGLRPEWIKAPYLGA